MNKIFLFVGFVAVCNAASLHVVPAGETIFQRSYLPSVSVVRSAVAPVVPSVVRSFAPDVVSSVVPVSVSDVELSDWEAYKVKLNSIPFAMENILQ